MPSLSRTAFWRLAAATAGAVALAAGVTSASASIPQGHPFGGVPYVGALFHTSNGTLGSHFCTASVVSSPKGNLVITSAHCMSGESPSSVVFAPGYANGKFPFGTVGITAVYTNLAWSANHNIDDDVAILRLSTAIQGRTSALTLVTGDGPRTTKVIGYPDGKSEPVECTTGATWFTRNHQMKFVCGGYPDGTSGGPWIISKTDVYGVIGGYQQGGIKSWISYSPYFGGNIRTLYDDAVAQDS